MKEKTKRRIITCTCVAILVPIGSYLQDILVANMGISSKLIKYLIGSIIFSIIMVSFMLWVEASNKNNQF